VVRALAIQKLDSLKPWWTRRQFEFNANRGDCANAVDHAHTNSLDANDKLIQTRSHGTTTSYKHFSSTWIYQLVEALHSLVTGSLKKVLLANLRDAPCFGIQFDETTDLGNDFPLHWQAQLIAYVRFPDKGRLEIVDL